MNAPDSCLSIEEYYDKMLDFAASYRELDTKMELIIWQFMRVHPYNRSYSLDPVHCADGNYNASSEIKKEHYLLCRFPRLFARACGAW